MVKTLIVITYVDDLIVITDNMDTAKRLYNDLETTITIRNLGPINEFLRIEITRDRSRRSLSLSQTKYTQKLLQKFGYSANNTIKPLVPITNKIVPNIETIEPTIIRDYQQQIGSMIYLMTKTRLDLAYPMGLCTRFMSNPSLEHFKALERIQKYLTYTQNFSLNYHSMTPKIITYYDVDWGGDLATRRLTIGYICLYRGGAITQNS